MFTRNSILMTLPDTLRDPLDPNPDDDKDLVAGVPKLVNRRVDYDSSDDEDMINCDDEDKNDDGGDNGDDDGSQDDSNEGEDVNSSYTVNPGDKRSHLCRQVPHQHPHQRKRRSQSVCLPPIHK